MVFSLLFTGCKKDEVKHKVEAIPVQILEVGYSNEDGSQTYVGSIMENKSSSLSFSVPGYVKSVYVSEGEKVVSGQLLAELDGQSYLSSYSAAQASLKQAQDAYNRLKPLHEKGSISEIQWVEIETKLAQAQSLEAISKKNVDNCKLFAPYSGIIGKNSIKIGDNVVPGVSSITLLDISSVSAKVDIPENMISSIKLGQKVLITVSALGNQQFQGSVNKKGVVANPLSHTYEIVIPLQNGNKTLIPGMICKAQLNMSDSLQTIVLPNRAVKIINGNKKFVWLAQDGIAVKRVVKTGNLASEGIIITDGLSVGDKVIIKGEQKLSEGTIISVQ